MFNPPLANPSSPPAWAVHIRARSFDELRMLVDRVDGVNGRSVRMPHGLHLEHYRVAGAATQVAAWEVNRGMTVRGHLPVPGLHLGVPVGTTYRFGRLVLDVRSPQSLIVLPPGWEFSRTSPPGSAAAALIDPAALARELAARQPDALPRRALVPADLVRSADEHTAWSQALADVVAATAPSAEPLQLAHAEAALVARLADGLLRHDAARRAEPVHPRRLGRVEDWIEAHLAEPITLGRLCEVAGVGARALQKAFEARRGMSPLRFVTERRLLAAWRRLSQPQPGDTVTTVCLSCGFNHLARFSGLYRIVFGELPSRTLARSRG